MASEINNEEFAEEIRLRIEVLLKSTDFSDAEKLNILSKVLQIVEDNN